MFYWGTCDWEYIRGFFVGAPLLHDFKITHIAYRFWFDMGGMHFPAEPEIIYDTDTVVIYETILVKEASPY